MKNNINFIKEQIQLKNWTSDCCGKQDLDMPILSISTRYYPDFTAIPSFILGDVSCESEITYRELLRPNNYVKGKNEEDCKLKVKQWYKKHLQEAINKLLEGV